VSFESRFLFFFQLSRASLTPFFAFVSFLGSPRRSFSIAGDGDCGLCLQAGGEGILKAIADKRISQTSVVDAILAIAEQIEIDMEYVRFSFLLSLSLSLFFRYLQEPSPKAFGEKTRADRFLLPFSFQSLSGTSGALYSIFFNGLASGLRSAAESKKSDVATAEVWADALVQARDTLYQYTRGKQAFFLLAFPLD